MFAGRSEDKNIALMFEVVLKVDYYYRLGAGVAQLVEQLICNQPVGGSTPFTSSIFINTLNLPPVITPLFESPMSHHSE